MNISITIPKKENIRELHNLFAIVITDSFKKDGIDDENGIQNEVEKQLELLNQNFDYINSDTFFLIAMIKDKIIGTIAYSKPNNIIVKNLNIDLSNIPEITSVYVLLEFQRQGVGSLLFKEILKYLKQKNINNFYLDCGYKNSQSFWTKKLGKPTLTLKDYWGEELDHLIWYIYL